MGSQPPYDPTISLEPEPPAPTKPVPKSKTGRTIGILLTVVALLVVGGSTALYVTGVLGADKPDAPVRAFVQAYAQKDCDRLWSQLTDRGKFQLVSRWAPSGAVPAEAPGPDQKKSYCEGAFAEPIPVELTATNVAEQPDRLNATVEATLSVTGSSSSGPFETRTSFQVAKVAGIWKIDSMRNGRAFRPR
jgi:hypothetical protein